MKIVYSFPCGIDLFSVTSQWIWSAALLFFTTQTNSSYFATKNNAKYHHHSMINEHPPKHATKNNWMKIIKISASEMQRSRVIPPSLHGENWLRRERKEAFGRMYERSLWIGSVSGWEECVLQLQTFPVEYEDEDSGGAAILTVLRAFGLESSYLIIKWW